MTKPPPPQATPPPPESTPAAEPQTIEAQIEDWAKLQFLTHEIAVGLGIAEQDLLDPTHPRAIAMQRGYLLMEAKVRKSVARMAEQGSSPAQKQFLKLVNDRKTKERRHAGR